MSRSIHAPVRLAAGGLGAVAAIALGATVAFGGGGGGDVSDEVRGAIDGHAPRNVIVFIGDGMGTQEITAARYYQGVKNPLNVDAMPFTGFDTTWSIKPGDGPGHLPDYDPDSAATGTMWATGKKTIDERISQGPSTALDVPGNNYVTAMEAAAARGMKVGNVSTAEVTDATPAVQSSHISLRGCQGPADMANCASEKRSAGGLGSIAEQEIAHRLDVLLGGGQQRFLQPIPAGEPNAGKTLVQVAQDGGFRYVSDAAGLSAVSSSDAPVLGLFSSGNMTTEWKATSSVLGKGSGPVTCEETNRPADQPSLSQMTQKAIELLDNRRGFFLQVEGASIDKRDHAADACGQLGETVAFDDAVGVALDWQKSHPDTLIVVTADHSHTSQIVSEDASGSGLPTGYSTNLTTKDGQQLALTYGTAGFGGDGQPPVATAPSQQHTGAVVPVWAIGPRAAAVLGTNDHTDLFALTVGAGGHRHGWRPADDSNHGVDDDPATTPPTTTTPTTTTPTSTTPTETTPARRPSDGGRWGGHRGRHG